MTGSYSMRYIAGPFDQPRASPSLVKLALYMQFGDPAREHNNVAANARSGESSAVRIRIRGSQLRAIHLERGVGHEHFYCRPLESKLHDRSNSEHSDLALPSSIEKVSTMQLISLLLATCLTTIASCHSGFQARCKAWQRKLQIDNVRSI
jgi:hypothetical protein